MKLHKSITMDLICSLVEESMFGMSDIGLCIECGEEQYGVEPDARKYECEGCGKRAVYGAQELLFEVQP